VGTNGTISACKIPKWILLAYYKPKVKSFGIDQIPYSNRSDIPTP